MNLCAAAGMAIQQTLRAGAAKYSGDSRRSETVEEQLRHIEAHITVLQCGDRIENHLSHTIGRAAIVSVLRERASEVAPALAGGLSGEKTRAEACATKKE